MPPAPPRPPDDSPGVFDYSVAFSRLDTENDRQNNDYRNTAALANVGFAPRALALTGLGGTAPRLGLLVTYSDSVAASPNDIYDFRPIDRLHTERQLYAPNVDWQTTGFWHQHLVLDYDSERQVNNPNQDGFNGPTRGQFYRYQLDDQNDFTLTRWLTLTAGAFYTQDFASQRAPFISQDFGPEPQYTKDFTRDIAGVRASFRSRRSRTRCSSAADAYDDFNRFGGQWTYRVAGSYLVGKTGTTLRSSVATGFSPPTPQDRIFGNNLGLDPERDFGYDFGFEQGVFKDRLRFGANYFHNDLSNTIGYTSDFLKLENLGSAKTLGIEAFARWEPVPWLFLRASYTWLDAVSTSNANVDLPEGSRLLRQPRNEFFASVGVRPYKGLSPCRWRSRRSTRARTSIRARSARVIHRTTPPAIAGGLRGQCAAARLRTGRKPHRRDITRKCLVTRRWDGDFSAARRCISNLYPNPFNSNHAARSVFFGPRQR